MAILVTNFEQPQWGERKACVAQLEGIGRVTRRKVKLIRPPSGSSLEVPGAIRSTPWKASRDWWHRSETARYHRARATRQARRNPPRRGPDAGPFLRPVHNS